MDKSRPATASVCQLPQQPPVQWQADRICAAAGAGNVASLEAALLASAAAGADAAGAANCRDSQRHLSPLHWAAAFGGGGRPADPGACAAILLARGASPNARDANGCTPLHHSACYNSLAVCQQLLARRATRLDQRNRWGRTALMLAAWGDADRLDVARALLAAGAGVNVRDGRGRTALMWAAMAGKLELLRLLLSAGADWRRRNLDGRTAEQLARREGHAEAARLLAAAAVAAEFLKTTPVDPMESQEGQKDGSAAADAATATS